MSSKSVETLVPDIYALISNPKAFSEGNIDKFGKALAERLAHRLSEERGAGTLRVSNLGKPCNRQLWFDVHDSSNREPLPPAARLKYLFGDVLEELLLFLAREAGHEVSCEQAEVSISGVKGHIDAIVDGRLLDVKSASTFAFNKFKDHRLPDDDPFGYIDQVSAYTYGSKGNPELKEKDIASFLVIDKTLGHLVLDTYPVAQKDYDKVVEEKKVMLSQETPPERCYSDQPFQKGGNRKLGVECSYCPFKYTCWKDANNGQGLRTFVYSDKPVFMTHVEKTPRVTEVNSSGSVVTVDYQF